MGVEGLWGLVEGCHRTVKLEGLAQKRLAIDASIWIYQFIRGMEGRGQGARTVKNSHILGFFWRICKLLFFNIRPVFVFDGVAPPLKRQTLAARRSRNRQAMDDLQEANALIMDAKLRLYAMQTVEGAILNPEQEELMLAESMKPDNGEDDGTNAKKRKRPATSSKSSSSNVRVSNLQERDLFELPPLPENHALGRDYSSSSSSEFEEIRDDDDEDNEGWGGNFIHDELNPVKMDNETLDSLPPRMQLELVSELQTKSRETSWSRLKEMVQKAPTPIDFSKQQILNTLRRNELTKKLDVVRERVNKEHLTQGIDSKRIVSSANKEYVLTQRKPDGPSQGESEDSESESQESDEGSESVSEESSGDSDYERQQKRKRLRRHTDVIGSISDEESQSPPRSNHEIVENPKEYDENESWGNYDSGGYIVEAEEPAKPRSHQPPPQRSEAKKPPTPPPALEAQQAPKIAENFEGESSDDFEDIPDYTYSNEQQAPSSLFDHHPVNLENKLLQAPILETKETEIKKESKPEPEYERKLRSLSPQPPTIQASGPAQEYLDNWLSSNRNEVHAAALPADGLQACLNLSTSELEDKLIEAIKAKKRDANVDQKGPHVLFQNFLEGLIQVKDSPAPTGQRPMSASSTIPESKKVTLTRISSEPNQESIRQMKGKARAEGEPLPPFAAAKQPSTTAVPLPDLDRMTEDEILAHALALSEKDLHDQEFSIPIPPPQPNQHDDHDEEMQEVLRQSLKAFDTQVQHKNGSSSRGDSPPPLPPPSQSGSKESTGSRSILLDEMELSQLQRQQQLAQRDSNSLTSEMINDIKELLVLFGLPYVMSPTEAEAQCAFLEKTGLVEGIITDDSDTFLFGGNRIVRNMFSTAKVVQCYLSTDLSSELGLTRDHFIQLAQMVGSDYAEGFAGIGMVSALEILSEFPGEDGLKNFATWWRGFQSGRSDPSLAPSPEFVKKYSSKKTKLYVGADFPDPRVRMAYQHPSIDDSTEPFTFGTPDLEGIKKYMNEKLLWSDTRVEEHLLPVLRRLNARESQGTLEAFFGLGTMNRSGPIHKSARVRKVLSKFAGKDFDEGLEMAKKARKPRKTQASNEPPKDGEETDKGKRKAGGSKSVKARRKGLAALVKEKKEGAEKKTRRKPRSTPSDSEDGSDLQGDDI